MENMRQEEEEFVRAFISPSKRHRALSFLQSDKKRKKFLAELPHFSDFDSRFIHEIPAQQQSAEGIHRLLLSKGAGTICYMISCHPELDQVEAELERALTDVVGCMGGTIVICAPSRLAYYEGEAWKDRYILERID